MTLDSLVHVLGDLILILDAKSNSHILHLLRNGVSPKGIAILLVQLVGVPHRLGELHTELVGLLQVPSLPLLDERNDSITLLLGLINTKDSQYLIKSSQ